MNRRANPPRARVSAEEALAAVSLVIPPSTAGWSADLLRKHEDELRTGLGARVARGDGAPGLGAFIVDTNALPSGRALLPAGSTIALALERGDLVGVASKFDERLGAQVHEFPPSPSTIPVLLVAVVEGQQRGVVVPVELVKGVRRG